MALLRWLQPGNSLPNPRGLFSSSILPQAIAAANQKIGIIKPSVPHLVRNVGHTSSIVQLFGPKLANTPSIRFHDKRGSHERTSLFHTPPCILHMFHFQVTSGQMTSLSVTCHHFLSRDCHLLRVTALNFRGRPIVQTCHSMNTNFSLCGISQYTVQQ